MRRPNLFLACVLALLTLSCSRPVRTQTGGPAGSAVAAPTSQPGAATAADIDDELDAEDDAPLDLEKERARDLIEGMVALAGEWNKLLKLRDVRYKYTFRLADGRKDVSIERYIFDGELSWGKYLERGAYVFPTEEGELIQGYDGETPWMTIGGKAVEDPGMLKAVTFVRKTNFYWFTMMPKMMDSGVRHRYKGQRTVDGITYDLVDVTFNKGVGNAQDRYLLYINPKTHLVDRFLFTVMEYGKTAPYLMRVRYRQIGEVKIPTRRIYAPADWEGNVAKDAPWTQELMTEIQFNNGLRRSSFDSPIAEPAPR